jgi:hypothetical protein
MPDGAVFTAFDDGGRPTTGTVPAHEGVPAEAVGITYAADGSSVWKFQSGTSVLRNAKGDVISETMSDGSVFTRFDGEGRPIAAPSL